MVNRLPVTRERGGVTPVAYRRDLDAFDVVSIERIQAGDCAAYEPLWVRHWPWLRSFFGSRVDSKEEAEDLAGATLLAAFEQLSLFRGKARLRHETEDPLSLGKAESHADHCTFKTYLGAIARNKLARFLRQRTMRACRNFTEMCTDAQESDSDQMLDMLAGCDTEANPLIQLLQRERQEETYYALAYVGLRSGEQFKTLLFHHVCGLAHKEIAEILDLRDETVNTRLQEGRRKLNRYYQALSEEAATAVC
jgi:RNA polymerase sigma factor (sigma-70 family)